MSRKELKLIITADGQQATRELARLQGQNRQVFGAGAGQVSAYAAAADGARRSLQGVLGTLAGLGTARYLVGQIDEFTKYNAQLKLATSSTQALATAQATVRSIATEAQASLSGIGTLYARISNGTAELGIGQQKVAEITRSVALALKVSGATAQESASAILQLSQAFGSGVLRGEEFNAVNEAAPRLMKAMADGLGVPVGALRGMAEQGKLTSEVLAITLPKALQELEQEAKSVQTIGGAFQTARNELMLFVGQTADSSGAVQVLTSGVGLLTNNIDLLASAALGFGAAKLAGLFIGASQAALGQVVATRAAAIATLEKAKADAVATGAAVALTSARVAELRAAVLATSGASALAVATNGLIPAQAKAAAASTAHTAALTAQATATRAASVTAGLGATALRLLGGPVGLITTLLGVGATAWMVWGSSASKAIETAEKSVFERAADFRAELQAQIDLIEKRNAAARANPEIKGEKSQQNLGDLLGEVTKWKNYVATNEAQEITRRVMLQKALETYGKTVAKVSEAEKKAAAERASGQAATDLIEVRQRLSGVNQQYLEDLGKYKAALDAGAISEAEYVREVGQLAKKTFDASTAGKAHTQVLSEGASAAKAATEQLQDLTLRARERLALSNQELAAGRQLTDAEKEAIKVNELLASAKGKLGDKAREQVQALFAQAAQAERLVWVQGQAIKATEALQAAEDARIKAFTDSASSAEDRLKGMQEEAEAANYAEKYQVSLAQAIERTAVARLREQQAIEMAKGVDMSDARVLALQAEIDAREKIIAAIAGKEVREASTKLREDQVKEWDRTWGQVGQSFVDALMQGGKSVKQYLEGLFRTIVLRPLLAPIAGAITSGFGGAAAAGQAGGAGGALSGGLDIGGTIKNVYSTITSGFTQLGNQVAFAAQDMGAWLANNTTGALNSAGSSLMSASGAIGTAASYAAGAAAGVALGRTISGGYSAVGKSGNTAVNAGTIIGSIFGGPIGGAIGGAIGGLVNRAFGRKLKDSGIAGSFGGSAGFSGQQYDFYKGGWFSSDKTKYRSMDSELQAALAKQYELLADNTTGMAGQLKLSATALDTYTRKIRFSTRGLSGDQVAAKLQEEFDALGNEMAALVLGTTAYTREGEAASATLVRLSTSITGTNALLTVLGKTLFDVGLVGADMASQLADKFGGLDAMAQATAAYYQTYYTASERADAATAAMTTSLGALGLSLPGTSAEFRALVSGLDLTTEHGRTTYATLLQMAPEFAALQVELQRLADETAARLITAFTARGQLLPALDGAALATSALAGAGSLLAVDLRDTQVRAAALATGMSDLSVRALLTQASTGTLGAQLSDTQIRAVALATGLTEAQVRAGALAGGAQGLAAQLADAAAQALGFAGPVSTINRLLGEAASGVLVFGDRVTSTTSALTPAQLAVAALHGEVFALRTAASGTVVDVAGLSAALATVDTRTFVATVVGVFDLIGQRIKGILSRITDERVAVREDAMRIVGPSVMSPSQVRVGIKQSVVGLPGNAALMAAASQLTNADAWLKSSQSSATQTLAWANGQLLSAQTEAARLPAYYQAKYAEFVEVQKRYGNVAANTNAGERLGRTAYKYNADTNRLSGYGFTYAKGRSNIQGFNNDQQARQLILDLSNGNNMLRISERALASAKNNVEKVSASGVRAVDMAKAAVAAAEAKVKQEQLAYLKALQDYSVNASKAVTQLGRLREETVKYYESQRQLADLMTGTASSLRATVAQFRFDQLDPVQQLASLQDRYNVAYSMALSTTGETLAGYGAELNSLINPLLQKAQEAGLSGTQYSSLVSTVLARAEAAASRLEANAPKDYQAESLGLLGQIDSTLAALEAGALTADQLIVSAINAGKDTTRDGLRAVVAALTGKSVPAFASGAAFSGGVVSRPTLFNMGLMGEAGDEAIMPLANIGGKLGVRAIGGGGSNTQALEAKVQALTEQVKELTRIAMATAVHAANTAENTRSMDRNGVLIYTATGQPVEVKPA